MKELSFPCDRAGVESVIPHRDPFIWVSRVLECDPGRSIVAELDVDPALPLFKGHFPSYPVLPGVIIMEALAQAASFCLLAGSGDEGAVGLLVGIDQARFRHQVRPGDVLRLQATITKRSPRLCRADVCASVDGAVCAQATQRYVLGGEGA